MQRRRWVAVVAVLAIALTSLSFLALKIGSRHPAVRREVLSRILPELGAELSIGELEIGLASLTLSDVDVDLGERGSAHIPSATVSLSYRELFLNGLEVRRALATAIVSDPTVTLRYGLPPDELEETSGLLGLGPYLPEYLGVSGATLVLEDARTGRSVTLSSLDLLLERREDGSLGGSASGDALGGSGNLAAEMYWDTAGRALSGEATLSAGIVSEPAPLPPDLLFDLSSGTLDASFSVSYGQDALPGVEFDFTLRDGDLDLPDRFGELTNVVASGEFDGARLRLQVEGAEWQGSTLKADAVLDTRSREFVRLELEGRGIEASRALAALDSSAAGAGISGRMDVVARARGRWETPAIDAVLRGSEISVGDLVARDVEAHVGYRDKRLDVDRLTLSALGGVVELSGSVELPGPGQWELAARGDAERLNVCSLAGLLGGDGASGRLSANDLEVEWTASSLRMESLIRWSDTAFGPVLLGSGAGGFILDHDSLSATLSDSSGAVSLSGLLESMSGDPSIEAELLVSAARLDELWASDDGGLPPVELTGALTVAGPMEGFSVGGSLVAHSDEGRGSVSLDGIAGLVGGRASLSLDVRSPDAIVRGVELPFSAALVADSDGLVLESLDVAGLGQMVLAVSSDGDRAMRGSVVVSEADLRDVSRVLADVELPPSVRGLVFASVSMSGTLASPTVEGQVQVGNGSALGVEGLSAILSGRLEGSALTIGEMALRQGGRPVVKVDGSINLGGDVGVSVRGEDVPGPLLGGGDETRFDVSLGIGGSRSSPTMDGKVEGSDGVFLGVPFDNFLARITGAGGVIRVDPLSLEKRGGYRARVEGSLPLVAASADPRGEEATITVEVDGDPLALLANVAPFAKEGSGSGTMQVVLAGTRGDVSVASAYLSVADGRIVPAGLFERIDDVEAELRVSDGVLTEGFVSGEIGGEALLLESTRAIDGLPEGLEPLFAAGMDLGLLALSTGPDGVRASIPGLMLPEDVGRVVIRGKEGEPALIIAGPPERPKLWGELIFSDMSFTYPLLESEEGVGGFLGGADWSLNMTAGRNLWYWRPDADLQVTRGSTLEFRGVPDEGTLCVFGRVESQRGTVTYANNGFDVREASVDFPFFCEPPRFYVLAETRVDDGTTISLTMDSYEGAFAAAAPGATFDESELRLASDSPDDDSREEILSKLQYGMSYELLESEEQASLERRRALEVLGSQLSGRIVRPLLSPVEGRLKRALNLDLVRFEIDFVEHFLAQLDLWQAQELGAGYQPFLTDTRITLGKYISRDWLLSYVGHADAYEEELGDERLGFRQELGVEYEVSRNTSLSMRVVYDPALAGWDRRLTIENRFRF